MENYHKGTLAFDDIGAFIAHRVDTPTNDIVTMAKTEMSYSVFQSKAADRGDGVFQAALAGPENSAVIEYSFKKPILFSGYRIKTGSDSP